MNEQKKPPMMAWIGRKKMTPSLKMVSSKLTQNRSFLPKVLLKLVTINKIRILLIMR